MKSFLEWAKLAEADIGGQAYGDKEYMDWLRDFESKFHTGDYKGGGRDRDSLYAGRIAWVLDELGAGEHEKFWDYVGGVNAAEGNYYMLLDRLVKRNHPHMYEKWKSDYPSPRSV